MPSKNRPVEAEGHVKRPEEVFGTRGDKDERGIFQTIKCLIEESEEAIEGDAEPEVRDAAFIPATSRAEHDEMAG